MNDNRDAWDVRTTVSRGGRVAIARAPPWASFTRSRADLFLTLGHCDRGGARGSVAGFVLRLVGQGVGAPGFAVPLTAQLPRRIRRVQGPPLDVARHVVRGQTAVSLTTADREQPKAIGPRPAVSDRDAGGNGGQGVVRRPQGVGARGHRAGG